MINLLLLLFLFSSLNLTSCTTPFLTCLSTNKIPNSIIYTPKTQNYTSIFKNYIRNDRFYSPKTLTPTLILTPLTFSHVQQIVFCAKNSSILLKIRSGGHDFEGLSYTSQTPFIILDMFNLRSIEIDIENEVAWVDAGATVGELYYKIWENSNVHAFPAGVCPTMAVGGHFSGGGYGNMLRKYGLAVDNILDAKIVVANSSILDRATMGEDLFWAISGGGGASYGVVLSYKIKLVTVPAAVTVFRISKTLEQNATEILHRWQFVADKFEKELFVRVNMVGLTINPNKTTVEVTFIGLYLGDSNKAVSSMTAQFPELGLKKTDCKEMTWIKSVLYWYDLPDNSTEKALLVRKSGPNGSYKIKSDYVTTPIPVEGLRGLLRRVPVAGAKFNPYGGRMSEIPECSTPFPHRSGNIYKIQYAITWSESGENVAGINAIREIYDYMTPFVSRNPRRAFLNYRDIDIGGSVSDGGDEYDRCRVYGVKYFGEKNFERLVRVKTMIDPSNFFSNEQSIYPFKKL